MVCMAEILIERLTLFGKRRLKQGLVIGRLQLTKSESDIKHTKPKIRSMKGKAITSSCQILQSTTL
jgi:hypothetical protein